MNGSVYHLPEAEDFERILQDQGPQAYVQRLVQVFGTRLNRSRDLRLFRRLRLTYAGARHVEVDRLFVREMSKCMWPELQRQLLKELPRSYRREVEYWQSMPWWVRMFLRFR